MSSSRSKGKGRADSESWSGWSNWSKYSWSDQYNCWYRYRSRTNPLGDVDYQHDYAATETGGLASESPAPTNDSTHYSSSPPSQNYTLTPPITSRDTASQYYSSNKSAGANTSYSSPESYSDPRTAFFPATSSDTQSPAFSEYAFTPSNVPVPSNYGSSSYRNYSSQGSSSRAGPSSVDQLTNTFQNASIKETIYEDVAQAESGPSATKPSGMTAVLRKPNITRGPGKSNRESLDGRYRAIPNGDKSWEFWKVGRVFMMLWTEPARSGSNTGKSHISKVWLNAQAFSEIRRFVVVKDEHGCCLCLAVHTYGGQATLKRNLPDPENHAIIHTSSTPPPLHQKFENDATQVEQLHLRPIRVVSELSDSEGTLDPLSRIHYTKIYTVEKDVRVLNIGMVAYDSMAALQENSPVRPTTSGSSSRKRGSRK